MNRTIELILLGTIIGCIIFIMFSLVGCSKLLPWVSANDGECLFKWCPGWFGGCLKDVGEDGGLIYFDEGYREYNSERDYWYDNGTGLDVWELENCEPISCKCDNWGSFGCAAYCVYCSEGDEDVN